jgi:RNA polymerase sigma-70 factor (ECF subfamily)
MKAEDVDSALVHAGANLRAAMEQHVDVDGALHRVRDSIRARRTLGSPVGDPVLVATAPPGRAAPDGDGPEDALLLMLYEEHAGPLLMFALGLTGGDRQRAEDVVQETLMRAWRNAHRLSFPGRSLRPWLMTVARRIATGDQHEVDVRHAAPDDPNVSGRWIADALRELSAPDREILIETYFRGRTVAEAATKLNLPLGTVKSRTYVALRALRAALEQRHR